MIMQVLLLEDSVLTDLQQHSGESKTKAGNGDDRNISSNEDADLFAQDEQVRSVESVRSVAASGTTTADSSAGTPTYEYLEQVNAYRCNWCKCIYFGDTKDTNAAHPCNFRGRGSE